MEQYQLHLQKESLEIDTVVEHKITDVFVYSFSFGFQIF